MVDFERPCRVSGAVGVDAADVAGHEPAVRERGGARRPRRVVGVEEPGPADADLPVDTGRARRALLREDRDRVAGNRTPDRGRGDGRVVADVDAGKTGFDDAVGLAERGGRRSFRNGRRRPRGAAPRSRAPDAAPGAAVAPAPRRGARAAPATHRGRSPVRSRGPRPSPPVGSRRRAGCGRRRRDRPGSSPRSGTRAAASRGCDRPA